MTTESNVALSSIKFDRRHYHAGSSWHRAVQLCFEFSGDFNKPKYITSALSSIYRAEYPTFVNHIRSQTFFHTLLTHYTCIYLVLYSMGRNKRATHEYTSFCNPRASVNYLQRPTPLLNRAHRCLFLTTPTTIKQNTLLLPFLQSVAPNILPL